MSDFSDDDAVAAEYVIGTLDDAERNVAERRRQDEPAFDRLIEGWAHQLAPLLEAIPAVEPDGRVRDAVLAEIARLRSASPGREVGQVLRLRRQVRIWRVATVGSAALAALLALWVARAELQQPASSQYLAVLQQGGGAPAFLVSLDLSRRRMTVVPSGASAEADKSLELWMIGANGSSPQSLGLLDAVGPVRPSLPEISADVISKATYAITLEQKGGSPTGQPSSAPVYAGRLVPERR